MIIWTIGAGGLLGRAIQRQASRHGIGVFEAEPIPWADEDAACTAVARNAAAFQQHVRDEDWAVLWAAGRAATASTPDEAAGELRLLTATVTALAEHRPQGRGAFFLTSSAGGVYAGSAHPPFDDQTTPRPLSAYGELKVRQELAAINGLDGVCPVVIGRMSNLYGPGQDLGKLQGLISRLALAAVSKQPVSMFVSLDTIRDYIEVDDAALVALHWTARALQHPQHRSEIRVIASGQPVSLGALIHLMQDVARVRIPIAIGQHTSSSAQAHDLRLVPSDDGTALALVRTTLPTGVKRVYLDILERFQQATTPRRA